MKRIMLREYAEIERALGSREEVIVFEEFIRGVPIGSSLDIGTAIGTYAKCCHKKGFEAYGIDISQEAVRFCERKRNGPTFICGSFPEDAPARKFSLITAMTGTPNHFDLENFVGDVRRFLDERGYVVLSFWRKIGGQDFLRLYSNEDKKNIARTLVVDEEADRLVSQNFEVVDSRVNTFNKLKTYLLRGKNE